MEASTSSRDRDAQVPRALAIAAAIAAALLASATDSAATQLIFLDNCKPNGCTVRAGFESSITNTSSIVSGTNLLPAFPYTDELWQALVACVQEVYRPFDVSVVDVDPAPAAHLEQMIGGSPGDLGFSQGVGGISPFTCSFIPNSISFNFAAVWGPNLLELCWTSAQELAHQFGLDHEAYEPDPMTYISGCGRKDFAAVDAPCGEFTPRACTCGGDTQNSYAELSTRAGASNFVFEGTFEDTDADWICDWSAQEPPPATPAGSGPLLDSAGPRCGTFDLENPGFRPVVPPGR